MKAYKFYDGEYWYLGNYESAGIAKAYAANEFDMNFLDVRVLRVPFLDPFDCGGFTDDCGSEIIMAELRHGCLWWLDEDTLLDPGEYNTEGDWEKVAKRIGAAYPDYYKPKETVNE